MGGGSGHKGTQREAVLEGGPVEPAEDSGGRERKQGYPPYRTRGFNHRVGGPFTDGKG